jgi:anaerobic magnesium-protoporphyrin IX monomethyl ester cyclase
MLAPMRTVLATLHSRFIHPSLALPCLAAFCGRDGLCGELLIREFTVHEPREHVLAALLAEEPDVVALSVYLWNRRESLALADALAVARPGLRVVLGGPEVSFDGPALFQQHPGVTALVHGEGELPLRGLLAAWQDGAEPHGVPRLSWRAEDGPVEGGDGPLLIDLDAIPSPFQQQLVALDRGLVYLETSRGCPYRCAFCMSALDQQVRSFSMARIQSDLHWLLERRVPQIKLVDRTFNYDPARAREIFAFILAHNVASRFHFEIGAHLLDEPTLRLLETVPPGLFQFEIGVQSTLPETLQAIGRHISPKRLLDNVRRMRQAGNIHLHLDLIAGLPEQDYPSFLSSVEEVLQLAPQHLQIEAVKILPGSPLRLEAGKLGIRFDPSPPYTVLGTPKLSFAELERLRGISRLLDLTWNSGRFATFLRELADACGTLTAGLEKLQLFWARQGLFRHPLAQRAIFEQLWSFVQEHARDTVLERLREALAYDFARSERVIPEQAPPFCATALNEEERLQVRMAVKEETDRVRGQGIKVQHFAARFQHLSQQGGTLGVFIYLTVPGRGMEVHERWLPAASFAGLPAD